MSVRSLYTTTSLLSVDNEKYFVIDAQSRSITPPSTFKNFGVESDENSNRVYFKCPRYVGNTLDLSTLNLRVNYKNAKGDKDQYIVTDVTVDGDNVIFSWLLSRKCTMYSGILSFIVCAVKTNSSGVIVNEWNTTLCTGAVLGGLEVEAPEIPEDVNDLVNQLVDLINESVANVKVAEAQAIEAVSKAPNSLFANAIKGEASGKVIRVEDVSPVEHSVGVKVICPEGVDPSTVTLSLCGKNTFNVDKTIKDLSDCSLWGVAVLNNAEVRSTFMPKTRYTVSFTCECIETVEYATLFGADMGFALYGNNNMIACCLFTSTKDEDWLTVGEKRSFVYTFTTPANLYDEGANFRLLAYTQRAFDAEGTPIYNRFKFVDMQVELADSATEYEPYRGATYTPDSEGNVNAVSVAPTMTLFTDTEGVTVECKYTKDTNKVIESLIERITALESGV